MLCKQFRGHAHLPCDLLGPWGCWCSRTGGGRLSLSLSGAQQELPSPQVPPPVLAGCEHTLHLVMGRHAKDACCLQGHYLHRASGWLASRFSCLAVCRGRTSRLLGVTCETSVLTRQSTFSLPCLPPATRVLWGQNVSTVPLP